MCFSLPALSLLDAVDIRFSASVARNAPRSEPAFVCRSPFVGFETALRPASDSGRPIEIGGWPCEPHAPARNPLARLLDLVFRPGSAITRFALGVATQCDADSPDHDALTRTHPLRLVAPASGKKRMPIVRQLIDELAAAAADASPQRIRALAIDLTLYAADRPVLQLRVHASFGAKPPS